MSDSPAIIDQLFHYSKRAPSKLEKFINLKDQLLPKIKDSAKKLHAAIKVERYSYKLALIPDQANEEEMKSTPIYKAHISDNPATKIFAMLRHIAKDLSDQLDVIITFDQLQEPSALQEDLSRTFSQDFNLQISRINRNQGRFEKSTRILGTEDPNKKTLKVSIIDNAKTEAWGASYPVFEFNLGTLFTSNVKIDDKTYQEHWYDLAQQANAYADKYAANGFFTEETPSSLKERSNGIPWSCCNVIKHAKVGDQLARSLAFNFFNKLGQFLAMQYESFKAPLDKDLGYLVLYDGNANFNHHQVLLKVRNPEQTQDQSYLREAKQAICDGFNQIIGRYLLMPTQIVLDDEYPIDEIEKRSDQIEDFGGLTQLIRTGYKFHD